MQTPREGKAGGQPALHCDGNMFPSPADEPTSNFLVSPRSGSSTPRPEGPQRRCSSGRGFLKKKFPFLLKRKESLQGQVASRSRLCMEDTHESPIQAFRKPAPRGQRLVLDSDDDSTEGKVGPSLLQKLLCLKAKSSKLQKPHCGLRASPLHKPGASCGPVAALSRTADPHGESPLRWKPKAEIQSPPAVGSVTELEKISPVSSPGTSCVIKPWRTFRDIISSRAKKGSVLPGNERGYRATEDGNLGLSAGPETSLATKGETTSREPQSNTVATRDKNPQTVFLAEGDGTCRTQKEKESSRTAWHGLEIHGRTGGVSELESTEEFNSLGEEQSHLEENPLDILQRRASDLSGGTVGEAEREAMEDTEEGGVGYWGEAWAGGDQDLADLAENPGGQGMVIGTRDLGWLTSELLGGSTIRPAGWKTEAFAQYKADACKAKEDNVVTAIIAPEFHRTEMTVGTADATTDGDVTTQTVPADKQSSLEPSPPCETSEDCALEETGTQAMDAGPLFLARDQGPPPVQPSSCFNAGPTSQPGGSCVRMSRPGPEEMDEAAAQSASSASEDAQSKLRLYRAAAEIVGAAIDAAAEQLAQKEALEWARSQRKPGQGAPSLGLQLKQERSSGATVLKNID